MCGCGVEGCVSRGEERGPKGWDLREVSLEGDGVEGALEE